MPLPCIMTYRTDAQARVFVSPRASNYRPDKVFCFSASVHPEISWMIVVGKGSYRPIQRQHITAEYHHRLQYGLGPTPNLYTGTHGTMDFAKEKATGAGCAHKSFPAYAFSSPILDESNLILLDKNLLAAASILACIGITHKSVMSKSVDYAPVRSLLTYDA